MLRRWLYSISERLPAQCALCHAWPARPVCDACVSRFAQPRARCPRCALPLPFARAPCPACLRDPPALDACVAAVGYAFPWSRLVIGYKFHGQPGWAGSLASLMRHAPWAEPALEQAERLLPVPLSAARLRSRGFNQALELARLLEPSKVDDRSFLRILDTPPQSSLDRAGRARNLQHAFAIAPEHRSALAGRHLLLVDDVMTTGATLYAAARCLRAAGATWVGAIVFARADGPGLPEPPA